MKKQIGDLLVIKVGTSTLTKRNQNGGLELDTESFGRIGQQVIDLKRRGYSIVVVSSAAITAGMVVTGLRERPTNSQESMPSLQALASIGWRHILNAWDDALQDLLTGGLLVTRKELEQDCERSEFLKVVNSLLISGAIPIINENDAMTHEEVTFGDNDTLAAHVAVKLKNSNYFQGNVSVVILSDVYGVYRDVNDTSTVIRRIQHVDEYQKVAKASKDGLGTGGMVTKFRAVRVARAQGVEVYISHGRVDGSVARALLGDVGTHFVA